MDLLQGVYGKGRGASRPQNQTTLKALHKSYPFCCYCGRRVRLLKIHAGMRQPGDLATIEHRFSKLDIRRSCAGAETAILMACTVCNLEKSIEQAKQIVGTYNYHGKQPFSLVELCRIRQPETATFIQWIRKMKKL